MKRFTGVMAAILVGVGIMGITPALGSGSRTNNHQYSDCGQTNDGNFSTVPEPSTMILLGSALAGLVLYGVRGMRK